MLRGQAILRPNNKTDGKPDMGSLLPMPDPDQMRSRFDNHVREAFSSTPEGRNAHYQAALAIYAALSVGAGDSDTKVLDTDRWQRAITMAIGPIETYNGRRIVLPHGYSFDQFRDSVRRRIEDLAESGRLDESWLLGGQLQARSMHRLTDLPLENIGDGRYVLKTGDGIVVDKEGVPVILNFNVGVPFRTSGHGLERYSGDVRPTAEEIAMASRPVTGRALPRPIRKP